MEVSHGGITLSANALSKILDCVFIEEPVLQVLAYKQVANESVGNENSSCFRLMLSDGVSTHQRAIVSNQDLVHSIRSGNFEKFTLVKLTRYYFDNDPDDKGFPKKIIYIVNMEVLKPGSEVKVKLGNPIVIKGPQRQQTEQQPQPQQFQQNQQQFQQNQQQFQQNQQQFQQNQHQPQYQQNNTSNGNDFLQRQPQQNRPQNQSNNGNNDMNQQARPNVIPNDPYGAYNNSSVNNQRSNQYNSPQKTNIRQVMPSTPSSRACNDEAVIDIASLTPYIHKWVIKGRVTQKSSIRTWSNAKGDGQLFSFTITDKSGEIKLSAFNQECIKWHAFVQQNKVYYVAKGQIKAANKRYTNAEYECTLNSDSQIEECMDSSANLEVPQIRYEFVPISALSNHPITSPVDVIGVIESIGEVGTVVLKTKNKETKKRNITIVDMTRHAISVTLWGEAAETFGGEVGQVFVSKSARLGEYGGRSLSAGDSIWLDPDLPETRKMKNWFANVVDGAFTQLTNNTGSQSSSNEWRVLKECLDLNSIKNEPTQAIYSKVKATIMRVGQRPIYRCCPKEKCGKKLDDGQTGDYQCSKCNQTYQDCLYRYKADIEISDSTATEWITLWDEKGESLLGMKPADLHALMQQDKEAEQYEKIMQAPSFKTYIFTIKSGVNTYNNEDRLRHHCQSLSPLDFVSYSKKLIDDIKLFGQTI